MMNRIWARIGMSLIIMSITVLGCWNDGAAQVINLKTAPVATGDQFLVQPPVNVALGNLSIALDDTLADPFINPAKTHNINGVHVYMLPTFYRITNGNGGARTLSVGGLTSNEEWFGGIGVAVQDMNRAPANNSNLLKNESTNNNYAWALAGKPLSSSLSLGARVFWAGLGAIEGVDLLYPRSQQINQDGYMLDFRVGLHGTTSGRGQYEAIAVYARTDMTHKVTYDTFWNTTFDAMTTQRQSQVVEENQDKTNTLGLHLGYDGLVGNNWRLGGILTFNYKNHPKIPNYDLMNIPRDPGNSWAFNAGFGTSNTSDDNVTIGADFIIEPIWSNTWVEAQEDIYDSDETRILVSKGEKTIENDFSFLNSVIKTGLGWKGEDVLLQAGIRAKTYRYKLKQQDYVEETSRRQREHWTEWTFSFSGGAILNNLEIKYTGLITTGTGQPGTVTRPVDTIGNFDAMAAGYIFAPDGDLTLQKATIVTHQITVSVPL